MGGEVEVYQAHDKRLVRYPHHIPSGLLILLGFAYQTGFRFTGFGATAIELWRRVIVGRTTHFFRTTRPRNSQKAR